MNNPIFLIGFMGSGKTSLGKRLANKFHIPFHDTDSDIEYISGKTISEIFETDGEVKFREMEAFAINRYYQKYAIIATGGGLPCFNKNIEKLNSMGTTVYLQLSSKSLYSRLKEQKSHRPLIACLSDEELKEFIDQKLMQREPIYLQSKIVVDVLKTPFKDFVKMLQ